MRSKTFTLSLSLFFLFLAHAEAQKLGLKIGMNLGGSRLYHNSDYEHTKLGEFYESVAISHPEGYTWEQFTEDYGINKSFIQPRFGFSAHLTYRDLPIFLILESMSSTSGYEKMAYSGTLGMGKDFEIGDNLGMFLTFLGGYKLVRDKGFGSSTITSSIGHKTAQKLLEGFFNPVKPLGPQTGSLFALRLGVGKLLGETQNISVGIEGYGELDLTDRIKRNGQSRMTNVGAHAYMRFRILGKEGRGFSPPAYGH